MNPRCISMRVILFKDGTQWMTHSLNFDASIDSRIRSSALRELGETIQTQIDGSQSIEDQTDRLVCTAGESISTALRI